MKAAVFASGGGTNFEALMEKQQEGLLIPEISLLVCDKKDAFALQRAKNHNVPARFYNPKAYANKEEYETDILKWLKEEDIDLIILAGYMRYIGKVLLENYEQKIVNLHPAYLPEFPGAHAIADAYNAKVPQTGVTVHYVDEGVDTGPVILQKRLDIDPKWDLETLEKHVHALEYDIFYQGINKAAQTIEKTKEKTKNETPQQ
jgi:formyltetrahydrofolate-dependent phosphoribosylglycinamide formyltransferase